MIMLKKLSFFLLVSLLILPACQFEKQPWNPIIQETDFLYLENLVNDALGEIDNAEINFKTSKNQEGHESLDKAKQIILVMKNYYIPLTELRQIIYDADRFLHLKRIDETKKRLEQGRLIVLDIDKHSKREGLERALEDLNVRIDECLLSLNDESETHYEKLKELGNEVNLMLVKGELVTSGSKFD